MGRSSGKLTASSLVMVLLLAACSGDGGGGDGGEGSEEASGDITVAAGTEPSTLDPQLVDDGGERAVNDNIYETLLARDPEGNLIPSLATEEPEQLDNRTWQFNLQEGVTFHNGEEFNADAVVASVERLKSEELESEMAVAFFPTVVEAEAVDDFTVNIKTNQLDTLLPARSVLMRIVPPEASQEPDFDENPVGTGPFKFVEWVKGDHITLERHDDYWGENPGNIATAEYRFIEEPSTRLSALIAGEVDLMPNLFPEDTDNAPKFASVPGFEHPFFILNTVGGLTEDIRVREAFNYAIDKEAVAEDLFQGYAQVTNCHLGVVEGMLGYNPELDPFPYDPDRARELIAEAGVEGAEVEIVGTSGRWLKDRETAEYIAAALSEVGLDANATIYEFSEYLDRLFDKEVHPDAIFLSGGNDLVDPDRPVTSYYRQDGASAFNDDERIIELSDRARQETDEEARGQLYQEIFEHACDQAYFLYLVRIHDIYGMSERLDWEPRLDFKMLLKDMSVS